MDEYKTLGVGVGDDKPISDATLEMWNFRNVVHM